jgi:exodeoxyribonuclease VII large subunit
MEFDGALKDFESSLSPLTVSQITSLIRDDLENKYPDITVEGEISNCKTAASGHLYFSLKDEQAVLQAVMFRRDMLSLSFVPRDGMKVWARGGISVYPGRGQYQLITRSMRKAGLGDILAMLEERKQRFAKEGLFDESRKKPIPVLPSRIAVVTSPTGAAVRDVIRVLHRRNPKVSILVLPALVQGEEAAISIAARIRQANLWNLADVLIVGRGGGSIEDLLPFSEEIVVRAIAESHIPVISAVGHETDWALSDYAADLRAPTPSAAAEMACSDINLIYKEITHFETVLAQSMQQALVHAQQRLSAVSPRNMEGILVRRHLLLAQQFDTAIETIRQSMQKKMDACSNRLTLASSAVELSNPRAIMKRGFSVVEKQSRTSPQRQNGEIEIVRSAKTLTAGDEVHILFYEGEADASIQGTVPGDGRSKEHERL